MPKRKAIVIRKLAALAAIAAVTGMTAPAQPVGAVRGWFSTPGCVPEHGPEGGAANEDQAERRDGAATLGERARRIAELIPSGRGQKLARKLERSLAPREHLKYVCKDDQETGYVVRFPVGLGTESVSDSRFVEFRYELRNLGRPQIEFDVSSEPEPNIYHYYYELQNGNGATRPIGGLFLVLNELDQSVQSQAPVNWSSNDPIDMPPVAPQAALYMSRQGADLERMEPLGKIAHWFATTALEAGERASGFTATSTYKPGWTTAYVASKGETTPLPRYLEGVPDVVLEEVSFLQRWENRWSAIPVIGPKFSPDASSEEIARNWQTGMQVLIAQGWLREASPYIAEVLLFLRQPMPGDFGSRVRSEPAEGMEALLDRILRMVF